MNRWPTAVLILACAALGAVAAAQAVRLRGVQREMEHLRDRVEKVEARQKEAAEAGRAEVDGLREQVARVELAAAARALAPDPPRAPGPAAAPSAAPEDVGRIVEEKVEEKIRALREEAGAAGGDRKKPLHDIARELGLDPARQSRVAEIADAAKREIFELLRVPRPDGTSLADDLVDAFLVGDALRVQQAFLKVFSEKVPGGETTYLEGTVRIREKAWQGLEQAMGPELCARFRHMNVNPENIETGFDPWVEYLRQRSPR